MFVFPNQEIRKHYIVETCLTFYTIWKHWSHPSNIFYDLFVCKNRLFFFSTSSIFVFIYLSKISKHYIVSIFSHSTQYGDFNPFLLIIHFPDFFKSRSCFNISKMLFCGDFSRNQHNAENLLNTQDISRHYIVETFLTFCLNISKILFCRDFSCNLHNAETLLNTQDISRHYIVESFLSFCTTWRLWFHSSYIF